MEASYTYMKLCLRVFTLFTYSKLSMLLYQMMTTSCNVTPILAHFWTYLYHANIVDFHPAACLHVTILQDMISSKFCVQWCELWTNWSGSHNSGISDLCLTVIFKIWTVGVWRIVKRSYWRHAQSKSYLQQRYSYMTKAACQISVSVIRQKNYSFFAVFNIDTYFETWWCLLKKNLKLCTGKK